MTTTPEQARTWRKRNPEKVREYERRARAKDPERFRQKILRATHKFKGYPAPTRPKPEFCECCGGPPGKKSMALDHDHVTGKFRGWICHSCNLGIGRPGDTIGGLMRAVTYLEKNT